MKKFYNSGPYPFTLHMIDFYLQHVCQGQNVKVKTLTQTGSEAVYVALKIPGHISLKKLISAHQQNTKQNRLEP